MARTPKTQALGVALRREREEHGLTTRDLADRIGRNHGEISRWETGDRTPKPEHVAQLLTALGLIGGDDIMSMAYDTDAPLWVATTLPAQRQQLAALVDAEQNAAEITEVSPLLIPGLLQTNDYIRAIMSGGGISADETVTRVAIRIGRRDVIIRPKPALFTAFIGEAAIHQVIGDRSVLIGQLRHLLEMAQRPNVTVRVVPFDSGWQPALVGAYTFIQSENSVPVVHIELYGSGLFLHEERDVGRYQAAVGMVRGLSLSPGASTRLITEASERMEKSA